MTGLRGQEHPPSEQFEGSPTIHAALQQLQLRNLALRLAIAVRKCHGRDDRRLITAESSRKAVNSGKPLVLASSSHASSASLRPSRQAGEPLGQAEGQSSLRAKFEEALQRLVLGLGPIG